MVSLLGIVFRGHGPEDTSCQAADNCARRPAKEASAHAPQFRAGPEADQACALFDRLADVIFCGRHL
jgi:hypothetical protein